MREIKFRALIPERNATIYFDLTDLVHPARKDLFSKRELLIPWLLAGNKPDEYTGLKDKNGKEIYEGDIIRVDDPGGWRDTIVFRDGKFTGEKWNIPNLVKVQVIGNIYENLLEVN